MNIFHKMQKAELVKREYFRGTAEKHNGIIGKNQQKIPIEYFCSDCLTSQKILVKCIM